MDSATQYEVMPPLNWLAGEWGEFHPRQSAWELEPCQIAVLTIAAARLVWPQPDNFRPQAQNS